MSMAAISKFNSALIITTCFVAAFLAGLASSEPKNSSASQPNNNTPSGRDAAVITTKKQRDNNPVKTRSEQSAESDLLGRSLSNSLTANYDPLLRLEIITYNPDPIERVEQWLNLIDSLNAEEIQFLLKKMTEIGTTLYNRLEHNMVLEAWARLHPDVAFDYAVDRPMESSTRQAVMSYFVSVDPQAAIRMAKANDAAGAGGTGSMLEYAIQALAPTDPELATKLLSEVGNPQEYDEAIETLCLQYLKKGSEAAGDWVSSIENKNLRDLAIAIVAQDMALNDLKGAADTLLSNPGENSAAAVGNVIQEMTRQDSQSAISYLGKISDPATKTSALGGITNVLAATDPNAALKLIDSNPEVANDSVLDQFVWAARKADRALAADTIARIADQKMRKKNYDRILEDWSRNDPDRATEWLESRQFSKKLRDELLKQIDYYRGYLPREYPAF